MTLLIVGLILWCGMHLLKRVAPDARAGLDKRFGEGAARGIIALILLVSVVLMVIGYRGADVISIYNPMPGMGHLNNLLMLIAVLLFGVGSTGSWLSTRMRNPMLTAVKIWAVAHLLVNGDMASIILFGGMLLWAVAEVVLIKRTSPPWTKATDTKPGPRDVILLVFWLIAFGIISLIHIWLGHSPFLGNYA